MGYIVPMWELRTEDVLSLRNDALLKLADMIKRAGKIPEEFQVRNILPKELGLTNDRWEKTYAAADTEEAIINLESLGDDKFLVIYGVALASKPAKTYKLAFKTKATTKDVIQVQSLHAHDYQIGYLRDPIGYSENSSVIVTGWASATGADTVILLGFVAERKGETFIKE